jgi:polyribonucleotide nucleotidyltransferase
METIREIAKVGDKEIIFETGKLAKQANTVVVRLGETTVMVAVTLSTQPKNLPFLPMTVEYRENNAAGGKIPGGYFKREGRPTEKEIICCRLIDRPCRPLFPKMFRNEVQIVSNCLSHDKQNEPDVMAISAASAALSISSAPWAGPIAGIRVGRIGGEFIAFPTYDQIAESDLNLIVACSRDAVVMVEAGAEELEESVMIDALMFAKENTLPLIAAIDALQKKVGKEKQVWVEAEVDTDFRNACQDAAEAAVTEVLKIRGKHERHAALRQTIKDEGGKLLEKHPEREEEIFAALGKLESKIVRRATLHTGVRVDGRGYKDIRDIYIEAHPEPRPHGSALFQRGETQAYVTATLGTERDGQRLDTIRGDINRNFLLHYNFPPFSVGEARPMRGTSRREIGHGTLAERALKQVMPSLEDFPYTVRIVSDTFESNGSSSMAAVCGGCLALMDAGVPIKKSVAGIAMGLLSEGDKYCVLSDILGDEDHMGDMDFKCTGTRDGITALQMDIKVAGLTREILENALQQAKEGRLHILDKMDAVLSEPREDVSQYAPRIVTMSISVDKIRNVIGAGGKVIRGIQEQTGCQIAVDDAGTVTIASSDMDAIDKAKNMIEALTVEAEPGAYYSGVVRRIMDFGAFVEILPGTDGLCHISELEPGRVEKVTDVLNEGDDVVVKVLSVDDNGRIKLSRKAAFGVDPDEVKNLRG